MIHKYTKFHTNSTKTVTARPVTNFIRQIDDRQTKFLLQFLSPRGPKRGEKKVSAQSENFFFRDCSNTCPPGLRTYKNKCNIWKKNTHFCTVHASLPMLHGSEGTVQREFTAGCMVVWSILVSLPAVEELSFTRPECFIEVYRYQNFNRYRYLNFDVNQYRYLKFEINQYRYLKF